MQVLSKDFENNQMIPKKFTCQGEGINPNLIFKDIPHETNSLVLIVDDPDAPSKTFVHWILFNIPIINNLKENSKAGIEGLNSLLEIGYVAPCPPSGTHRYFFKLYALDVKLDLKIGAKKEDLEKAMKGHIIDKAELIGLYKKS